MIAAIVLAAGQSTRMGADNKLLLPLRGSTVIANTVDAVLGSGVSETIIVLGHEAARVREALAGRPVTFVDNPDYEQGMATSIHAGLRAVGEGTKGVMICLSDLPLVEAEELRRLREAFEAEQTRSVAVPTFEGQRGNPVMFHMRYKEEILHTRGAVGGCKSLIKRYPAEVLEVEMATDHVLQDIDTLEAYQRIAAVESASEPTTATEPALKS